MLFPCSHIATRAPTLPSAVTADVLPENSAIAPRTKATTASAAVTSKIRSLRRFLSTTVPSAQLPQPRETCVSRSSNRTHSHAAGAVEGSPNTPHALMPSALMPSCLLMSPVPSRLSTTAECRDHQATRTTHARTKICTYDRVCAPISCTCATSRLHRKLTSAKMRTVARHESPGLSASASGGEVHVKLTTATPSHPPDDPASRPSVKIEPSTSGLGQTWGNPIRRGTRRDTSRKRSEPKPADPGAPAACTLCESKAWRSSHARGNPKPACSQN